MHPWLEVLEIKTELEFIRWRAGCGAIGDNRCGSVPAVRRRALPWLPCALPPASSACGETLLARYTACNALRAPGSVKQHMGKQ